MKPLMTALAVYLRETSSQRQRLGSQLHLISERNLLTFAVRRLARTYSANLSYGLAPAWTKIAPSKWYQAYQILVINQLTADMGYN